MSMQFANDSTQEYVLKGNGNSVHIKCNTPNCLKKDLQIKRLACQSVYLSTRSIPRFIPTLATEARKAYDSGATVTKWDNIGVNPYTNISNTDYFVNIRTPNNTACYTSTLFWTNVNNINQPPFYVPDANSIYYLPYYYCYNVAQFFDMIAQTINVGITQATGGLSNPATVIYDASSNTVNMSIPLIIATSHDIELSPSLQELLGFETSDVNYGSYITKKLIFSQIIVSINGVDYLNVSAKLQEDLFPFDKYVISSNLPVTPIDFYSSSDPSVGGGSQIPVLFMWRESEMQIQSGKPISIINNNMMERQKTFEDDTFGNNQIEFKLMLRSKKNQNWVEWVLPIGETMEIVLNTYRLF